MYGIGRGGIDNKTCRLFIGRYVRMLLSTERTGNAVGKEQARFTEKIVRNKKKKRVNYGLDKIRDFSYVIHRIEIR